MGGLVQTSLCSFQYTFFSLFRDGTDMTLRGCEAEVFISSLSFFISSVGKRTSKLVMSNTISKEIKGTRVALVYTQLELFLCFFFGDWESVVHLLVLFLLSFLFLLVSFVLLFSSLRLSRREAETKLIQHSSSSKFKSLMLTPFVFHLSPLFFRVDGLRNVDMRATVALLYTRRPKREGCVHIQRTPKAS